MVNQMELQHLRHLINVETTAAKQFGVYAQQCTDPQLRNYLQNAANKADQNGRMLMNYLQA